MDTIKFLTLLVLVSLLSFGYAQKKTNGYLHKVKITSHEALLENALVRNNDNSIFYNIPGNYVIKVEDVSDNTLKRNRIDTEKNRNMFVMLNENESNELIQEFCTIISNSLGNLTTCPKAKKGKGAVFLSKIGNVGDLSSGQPKISVYFPNKKLKRIKKKADEYYSIRMSFVYGGGTGKYIVMNKQKGEDSIKFRVKINLTATNKQGKVLWEKTHVAKEFVKSFKSESILVDKKNKYFKVKREPRLYHDYTGKVIGDYMSLSKEECMNVAKEALEQILNK